MFTEKAKPIWIIGDPDNQRPNKWSSTILVLDNSKCAHPTEFHYK
jgi:hypothetical protein